MRLRKEIDEMQEKDILLIAKISDALAHPARIKIFRYIMQQNKSLNKVCNKDLVAYFDYSQATISQHVKKLKDAGLLEVGVPSGTSSWRGEEREECSLSGDHATLWQTLDC